METKEPRSITPFNRVLYVLFILLAVYQIFVKHDYLDATGSLGIGLIFDPFNPKQPWQERPMWQKVWLFGHLAIVASLFGLAVGLGDR